MLKAIQRILTITLLVLGGLFLLYQGFLYWQAQDKMPPGMRIAGVNVAGMTRDEATAAVSESYMAPVNIFHQDERVPLNPADVGFVIDVASMVQIAEERAAAEDPWLGFVEFVLKRPFAPTNVELRATHDRELLTQQLQTIASLLDRQARPAQISADGQLLQEAQSGLVTDVEASVPNVEAALYHPADRNADLVVNTEAAPEFGMETLQANLERKLQSFDGVGSIFIMDLETGEEVSINAGAAISGLSILKIAIFVETYRVLDQPPNEYVQGLLTETAVRSSNFGANLLLHVIAGEDNTYEGAADLTEAMQSLGLVNTFMAIPYDAPTVPSRPSTYTTPANSRPGQVTVPDPARQTTAEDIGTLLSMIYYCAEDGGGLASVYPDEITPQECQAIIDLMVENTEGNLIRFGVPEDVPVSHKHGWDSVTHGDAGIVLSPGGDYVIVTYLHKPDTDFLVSDYSFPILWELSRITYNFFNMNDPYLEDPTVRAEEAAQEAAAAATATATAVEGDAAEETAVDATPEPTSDQ